jgi:hypothetical protein
LGVLSTSLVCALVLITVTSQHKPIYAEDNYLSMCWIKRFEEQSSATTLYFWALFVVPLCIAQVPTWRGTGGGVVGVG